MINNKTDINQMDKYGYNLLMVTFKNKCDINIVKLMINNKTDINQKDDVGYTPLKSLFKNYSKEKILLIISFFNDKKDIYGWNLKNYFYWNKRKEN